MGQPAGQHRFVSLVMTLSFGMSTDKGTGYFVYHMKDGSYEKLKVKVSGAPYMLHELK